MSVHFSNLYGIFKNSSYHVSNKELEAGKKVTIIDTVTLESLEVGTQYKLVGWQMLKEENAELLINGKE